MAQSHLSGQNRGFLGEINGRGGKTGWVFSNPGEIQPWARVEALSHQCPGARFNLENPEDEESHPTLLHGAWPPPRREKQPTLRDGGLGSWEADMVDVSVWPWEGVWGIGTREAWGWLLELKEERWGEELRRGEEQLLRRCPSHCPLQKEHTQQPSSDIYTETHAWHGHMWVHEYTHIGFCDFGVKSLPFLHSTIRLSINQELRFH